MARPDPEPHLSMRDEETRRHSSGTTRPSPGSSTSTLTADTDIEKTPPSNPQYNLTTTSTGPSQYFSLPLWRKSLIVFIASLTAFSATFSSTSLFSSVNEIAETFGTSPSVIAAANGALLFAMGCSSFVWVPIGLLVGRKIAYNAAISVMMLATIGCALAPSTGSFIALRILAGLEGIYFSVAGQSMLADVFEPVQRGTATGFFLIGSVLGPPLGPCLGGVLVTYSSWRSILWLQVGFMGISLVFSILFLPDIRRESEVQDCNDEKTSLKEVVMKFNIMHVFRPMLHPNVLFTDLVCGFLSWNQYTLLAAPRHLINPRFGLTTPLVAGLFYIAPGVGFVVGTIIGGKFSDMTVVKWIRIRGGIRLPQDRLNSGMIAFFFLIPAALLTYGWGLQFNTGGLALPIVCAFFAAVGLLMAFASVNTYCAEVLPQKRLQVITGKYFVQYSFSAVGSAVIIPMIDAVGIGAASTIGVALVFMAGGLALITAKHGLALQAWVEDKWHFSIHQSSARENEDALPIP